MPTNQPQATAYDFVQPGHKLNTQWPVLDLISERIATDLGDLLSERLQINMRASAEPTIRGTHSQCIKSLGETGTVHEITVSPLS